MTHADPRTRARRVADTKALLERDVDCWVATTDPESGEPYLVPLSFVWTGTELILSTGATSRTGRALETTGLARLAFGATRDVVMVDGTIETVEQADLPAAEADLFAARTEFDPRRLRSRYPYFRVRPVTIQAWREENELRGRHVMRDGAWLA